MISLYVKTHNKTGLKYLGKTEQDPFKYKGSGVYWNRHLKVHGNDVTTEIIKECVDNNEVKQWGSHFSDLWNIVESSEWANMKPEVGDGGSPSPEGIEKIRKSKEGKKRPEITGDKNSQYGKYGKDHPAYGHKHTEDAKLAQRLPKMGDNNPMKNPINAAKISGENHPNFGKTMPKYQCLNCGGFFAINMLSRYHGDKCKRMKNVG